MTKPDRPDWMGLLSVVGPRRRPDDGATRRCAKRNGWVVVGFFALVVASWISSLS